MGTQKQDSLKVVIAGGGIGALEGALALRDLAGERVTITLIAAEDDFVYRPSRVLEPFAGPASRRYPLVDLASDIGVELHRDTVTRVDPGARVVRTTGGAEHSYDALLLAVGARPQVGLEYALTLDDRRLDEQLQGLVQDVEGGYAERLAFVAPSRMPWPLPLYELALLTARRASAMGQAVAITLATPEPAPLAAFGGVVSARIAQLLYTAGIETIMDAECASPEPNYLEFGPGGEIFAFDRVVAMPELHGPALAGLPCQDTYGFIPVDAFCRVAGVENVFAAGDATNLPVKHGGLAAQQADVAAAVIAELAGAPVTPWPLAPKLHGVLLGAELPLYLSADMGGAHSSVGNNPRWSPASKVDARYLSPYLKGRDGLARGSEAALPSSWGEQNGRDGRARGAAHTSG
jgi:sulfide:quinone oxidoreductase